MHIFAIPNMKDLNMRLFSSLRIFEARILKKYVAANNDNKDSAATS